MAVLALSMLSGPLRSAGLRIGAVSVTRDKSAELLRQMFEIAEASRLLSGGLANRLDSTKI